MLELNVSSLVANSSDSIGSAQSSGFSLVNIGKHILRFFQEGVARVKNFRLFKMKSNRADIKINAVQSRDTRRIDALKKNPLSSNSEQIPINKKIPLVLADTASNLNVSTVSLQNNSAQDNLVSEFLGQHRFSGFNEESLKKIKSHLSGIDLDESNFNESNFNESNFNESITLVTEIANYLPSLTKDSVEDLCLQLSLEGQKVLHAFCLENQQAGRTVENSNNLVHQFIYTNDPKAYLEKISAETLTGKSAFLAVKNANSRGNFETTTVEIEKQIRAEVDRFAIRGEWRFSAADVIIGLLQHDVALQDKFCFEVQSPYLFKKEPHTIGNVGDPATGKAGDPLVGSLLLDSVHYRVKIDNVIYDCPDDGDCALHALYILQEVNKRRFSNDKHQHQVPGGYDVVGMVENNGVCIKKLKLPKDKTARAAINAKTLALRNRGREIVLEKFCTSDELVQIFIVLYTPPPPKPSSKKAAALETVASGLIHRPVRPSWRSLCDETKADADFLKERKAVIDESRFLKNVE